MKKLYPDMYYKNIQSIPIEALIESNINAIMLDVDNTLIDINKVMPKGIRSWITEAKKAGIKLCILSNSNKKEKIEMVSSKLDIPYVFFAKKPLKKGYIQAQEILQSSKENTAAVGDQIFTDVLGANMFGITSILLEPIDKEDLLITKIKRPIENLVIKKYLKSKENK